MLYDDPELYDALLRPEEHAAHYVALAGRHPGPVLELACGSGQIAVPLAQAGAPVVGLDLSRAMLDAARRRAAAAGAAVELVEADMRTFDLGRRFALVFIARNSLLHLSTAADFAAAFAAVRRHLAPGGVFAFDVFNPDVRILARPAGERAFLLRGLSERYGELTVEATTDYDAATQVNRATWYISAPGRPDAWVAPLHLRSIFPQELPLLLAAGGLRLLGREGDLAGGAFTSTSPRQVCVCSGAEPA
jgi:SAM-dependent methyltransferase